MQRITFEEVQENLKERREIEDKEALIECTKTLQAGGVLISEIFDRGLYNSFCILQRGGKGLFWDSCRISFFAQNSFLIYMAYFLRF